MIPRSARGVSALAVLIVELTLGRSTLAAARNRNLRSGVVVEEVGKDSAGEKAGIKAGDVIMSWVRAAAPPANPAQATGTVRSSFDLADIELEQAPRGEVRLSGLRTQESFSAILSPGDWRIRARPQMPKRVLAAYLEGKSLIEAKEPEKGLALWQEAAEEANRNKEARLGTWLMMRIGDVWAQARKWDKAQAAYQASQQMATPTEPSVHSWVLDAQAKALQRQNNLPKAEAAFRDLVRYREGLTPESLALASSLLDLGIVLSSQGKLTAAGEQFQKSRAIREKLAPQSLPLAASLNALGVVARSLGHLTEAQDHYRRSLAIRERLGLGESLPAVATLNNLGNVAYLLGDLAKAEELHKRCLALRERLAPDSLELASSLQNLGNIAAKRGDLSAADSYYARAFVIQERLFPGGLEAAASLNNLGGVAVSRGDLVAADQFYRRSLALSEKVAPGGVEMAAALNNLGIVAGELNNLAAAEDFYTRSLTIREKLAPGSLEVAACLNNLGEIARLRGDLGASEAFSSRALAIDEKIAPEGLQAAETLNNLGSVAAARGDSSAAENFFQRALSIAGRLAPAGNVEAEALHSLGILYTRKGLREKAADNLYRAVEDVESRKGKAGSSDEAKSGFVARYEEYYRDLIDALVELGRPVEAFEVLERSRAGSLLAILAERDLVFSADVPPELEHKRKDGAAEYDRIQALIARLNPQKEGEKIEEHLNRLRELRDEREEIAAKIRKASPRFASLQYPQPLGLAVVRKALDPGTVLLSYSVGKEKAFLFAVAPEGTPAGQGSGLSVFTLPVAGEALRGAVESFRSLSQRKSESTVEALRPQGKALYELLIKPAEALIARSDRVLICPDGPLHTLPFGALVRQAKVGKKKSVARYLVEWKPVHTVVSATVYAELKKQRRESGASASPSLILTAFGDPKYPNVSQEKAEEIGNPELRSVVRRGGSFEPLPATRQEVEGIAGLYSSGVAKYLGEEATEERAKAVGKDVRYIHFACHGLLDERFPLNSALALTIPERPAEGQDNGLLQAWEIFERVRLDADLVTLSACETGLGKEMGGEGLIGLSRAFQYAGARSVLASLWRVSDESTAELMKRFYGYLKQGKSKDEALRLAQVDLIGGSSSPFSHPFHWAAFQLIGDWK